VTSQLTHPALTVRKFLGALPHVRKFYQVVGFSLPNNYLVHNSSINNLARGVLHRVFYARGLPPPQPREGLYTGRLRYFRNTLVRCFSSTTPVERQEFVEYYKGRRKTLYQRACDSLLSRSISRKDANIRAFVKAEFINSDRNVDPDPRVISPRDPRYNVEVGRYLRPIEHRIYAAIARIFGGPTVLKGYNAKEMGQIFADKWANFRKPVAIGLDASRFDQHVSVEALKWEHSVYNGIYHSNELRKLLKWQLRNKVTGHCRDGKLRYETNGCRMSGDMNTAMGNCLIMCALVHCYLSNRGINGSLANNGDDCTVIIESRDLDRFNEGLSEWFLEMGFRMVVERPVFNLEEIEFCQTHPIYTPDGYVMVRNFPKAISKDCLSLKDFSSPAVCKSWLDAVGQGGLALTGGIPVYQDFYSAYVRIATEIVVPKRRSRPNSKRRHVATELTGGLAWLSKNMERRYAVVDPRTRHSFYIAFGVTPDMQVQLERYYAKLCFHYRVVKLKEQSHLPRWV
jgi:hypothetical protein